MPKRPWNIPNLPVYSLETISEQGVVNFNICTYVSAVSMHPKRFMVAVYKGTQTLANLQSIKPVNLLLLSKSNIEYVRLFGKRSGKQVNKLAKIKEKTQEFGSLPVFPSALAAMQLQEVSFLDAGDHMMYLFDVVKFKHFSQSEPLYLQDLRDKKLVSV